MAPAAWPPGSRTRRWSRRTRRSCRPRPPRTRRRSTCSCRRSRGRGPGAPEYSYADGAITRGEEVLGALDLGPGKPEHIFAQTGRLPVFAGGNADVDIEMLASAQFALLVNHDDADREYAYTTAAEASLAKAKELGWTVVSMKDDRSTVYGNRRNDG
jgi:hypothetical protein